MQKKTIAIISDSFAGLILASQLERDGHTVTLIDTGDCLKTQKLRSGQHLPFYPLSNEFKIAIESLNSLFVEPITLTEIDLPPLSFEDGALKPFVGFGASKSDAIQPLSRLNSSRRYELNFSLEEKLETLIHGLKTKLFTYSEITRIEFTASQIDKVVINGSQEIVADQYVFLNSPRELIDFIPPENLGARIRARIMKSARWARVALEIQHHKPLFDGKNLLFLMPLQDDQTPCVGQFLQIPNAASGNSSLSTWETYLPSELCEDAESVASTIKNIRKLVKRAFSSMDDRPKEIITVMPICAADFAWILEQKEASQIADNLVFLPTLAISLLGLPQSVVAAHAAYSALQTTLFAPSPNFTPSLLGSDASC